MMQRAEMDSTVTLFDQLTQEVGPVVLVNTFHVAPPMWKRFSPRGRRMPAT
jgi:hypothetical protein